MEPTVDRSKQLKITVGPIGIRKWNEPTAISKSIIKLNS